MSFPDPNPDARQARASVAHCPFRGDEDGGRSVLEMAGLERSFRVHAGADRDRDRLCRASWELYLRGVVLAWWSMEDGGRGRRGWGLLHIYE